MITLPPDTPEDESSGVFALADSEPAETPSAATFLLPSPEDVARDNARGGRWAMNEFYDGCVLLGADDKPVMRNDGSRVGFFFRDAERLAAELADRPAPGGLPSADESDSRAAAWRAQRRALAPLNSGFNKDWDPQRPKSTLADMTKWTNSTPNMNHCRKGMLNTTLGYNLQKEWKSPDIGLLGPCSNGCLFLRPDSSFFIPSFISLLRESSLAARGFHRAATG